MNILVIDTSQVEGYIALSSGEVLVGKRIFAAKDQMRFLIPLIDELLREGGMNLGDLGLIKVCIGPGSFTGTRVGVITGKGLAYGAGIPIVGFHGGTGEETASLEILY